MPPGRSGLLLFSAFLSLSVTTEPAQAHPTAAEADLIRTINQVRGEHGLVALRLDLRLERAARAKTVSMLQTGTFAHGDLRTRLLRYGARGPTFGENLAWAIGASASATGIVKAWMRSPGHRANILRGTFRRIGIGRRVGPFEGHSKAAVVTANFAGT
jgi:uncharacterized protein YkwD